MARHAGVMQFARCCRAMALIAWLAMIASFQSAAFAQCPAWLAGPLHDQTEGITGGVGLVRCSTLWSPANSPPLIVFGGDFTNAGGVTVRNLTAWDGASFHDVGRGVNGNVFALAVYNGDLIVAGNFDSVGDPPVPANNIARFDGTNWHALGSGLVRSTTSFTPFCFALTIYLGDLIAGGRFDHAGDVPATNLARWNGSTWSQVGNGIDDPSDEVAGVHVLHVHTNNRLYIGGVFQSSGGVSLSNLAQYDALTIQSVGGGTGGATPGVFALTTFGNTVIVGGAFTLVGGTLANHIARWTPDSGATGQWSTLGTGLGITDNIVKSLTTYQGLLTAGGNFAGGVAKFVGSSWQTIRGGANLNGIINTLRPFTRHGNQSNADVLIAGGLITQPSNPHCVAQWDPGLSAWVPLRVESPILLTFELLGSRIVAGGSFTQSTTTSWPTNNMIGFDGARLTSIGGGVNGTVVAMKEYDAVFGFTIRHLIVGGDFTYVGDPVNGVAANRIAEWQESDQIINGNSWNAMGAGFNNRVNAIERFNNEIYAGGQFTASGATTINRIARYSAGAWLPLGTGLNGRVLAMKAYNGFLYVGGQFTTAGGINTGGLARWNGSVWSIVALPFSGEVWSLEVHNNELVIGGLFNGPAASPNITRWNGSSFPSLGPGNAGTNGTVYYMKSDGNSLYIAGEFTSAGGVPATRLARWNATDGWSAIPGGFDHDLFSPLAFGVLHGELQVAIAGGSSNQVAGWLRYGSVPWIVTQSGTTNAACHSTASLSVQPALGYETAQFQWRRNAAPLSDGVTTHGTMISGAHTPTLTFQNARSADNGSYDCVITSNCASVNSAPISFSVTGCCNPDISGDGVVNVADLLAVINSWGPCPAPPSLCLADVAPIGGDGVINVADLLSVVNGWGGCP